MNDGGMRAQGEHDDEGQHEEFEDLAPPPPRPRPVRGRLRMMIPCPFYRRHVRAVLSQDVLQTLSLLRCQGQTVVPRTALVLVSF